MDAVTLNTIGLALDIAGVALLFIFGLPNKIDDGRGISIKYGGEDIAAQKRWDRYRYTSWFALGLLVVGFGLQIASNHYDWILCRIGATV